MGPSCHTQFPTSRIHVGPWGSTGMALSREWSCGHFRGQLPLSSWGSCWDKCWASGDLQPCPHNSPSPTPVPGCAPGGAPKQGGVPTPTGSLSPQGPPVQVLRRSAAGMPVQVYVPENGEIVTQV